MRDHIARVIEDAPAIRIISESTRPRFLRRIGRTRRSTSFEPFGEQWVADAEARAKFEIEHQIDMRSRGVISRSILSAACGLIARRHRFSSRKVAHLCDVAMRVLMLDAANAEPVKLWVHDAKARSDELAGAVSRPGRRSRPRLFGGRVGG